MDMNLIYGVLGLVIGAVVSEVVRKGKVYLSYVESKTGENYYNQAKEFVVSLGELHPEDFAEDKLVNLLDKLDNKFGDHLSKNTIKEIVDFVVKTVVADINKEVAK